MDMLTPHHLAVAGRTAPDPVDHALHPELLLGMPHLTPFGLSRTFLLKELGHRHWLLLGRHLGLAVPDFCTPDGREAYAAISAMRVDMRLSAARANDRLGIVSDVYPVSGSRMESLHRLFVNGRAIGEVVLQSVFVARQEKENRSIRRAMVRHFLSDGEPQDSLLAHEIVTLRDWPAAGQAMARQMRFRPCPFEEFNGAGLFYFAEFAALVTRAFCAWEGEGAALRLDRPMSMLFLGNIEAGEELTIGLHSQEDGDRADRCSISGSDGVVLARVLMTE